MTPFVFTRYFQQIIMLLGSINITDFTSNAEKVNSQLFHEIIHRIFALLISSNAYFWGCLIICHVQFSWPSFFSSPCPIVHHNHVENHALVIRFLKITLTALTIHICHISLETRRDKPSLPEKDEKDKYLEFVVWL